MGLFAAAAFLLAAAQEREPVLPLKSKDLASFGADERLVAAYYAPPPGADPRKELEDMASVGVNIAVVVSGKDPDSRPVAEALEAAVAKNPRIRVKLAPFIAAGPAEAYGPIRSFFSAVPARHWAVVDGRPVIWLASRAEGAASDRAAFEALAARFKADFAGLAPYLVADVSWTGAPADRTCARDSAQEAPPRGTVASVGPGRARDEEGKSYRRSWYVAVQSGAPWAVVETWNGAETGVHESKTYGRKFLEFTRNFVRRFRHGDPIDPPAGKYSDAKSIVYTLKYNPREQGLRLLETEQSRFRTVRMAGLRVITTRANDSGTVRHLSFDVDESFSFMKRKGLRVSVEFWDIGRGAFSVEYEADDRAGGRRLKRTEETRFEDAGGWRRASFDLPDAWCGNGLEGGADFRIRIDKRGLMVRLVRVQPK